MIRRSLQSLRAMGIHIPRKRLDATELQQESTRVEQVLNRCCRLLNRRLAVRGLPIANPPLTARSERDGRTIFTLLRPLHFVALAPRTAVILILLRAREQPQRANWIIRPSYPVHTERVHERIALFFNI